MLEGLLDHQPQFVHFKGFRQVVVGAAFHRFDGDLLGAVRGDHHYGPRIATLLEGAKEVQTVFFRHLDIEEQQVGVLRRQDTARFRSALRLEDLVAFFERSPHAVASCAVIIDNQNGMHVCSAERSLSTQAGQKNVQHGGRREQRTEITEGKAQTLCSL